MNPPIFVDTNVPIYAAGRPHYLKAACTRVLLLISRRPEAFVTDAEVFQELLHRYRSLGVWPQGKTVLERFAVLMRDRVEPVRLEDVLHAGRLADTHADLSARDLLHLAVMDRIGSAVIVSADRDFDRVGHVQRLDPMDVGTWEKEIRVQAETDP